jgi:hypothetical protein
MKYHDDELCKQKIECILGFLNEINEIVEYPRSDREQLIRTQLELALQDLMYLNLELEAGEDDTHS